MRQSAKSELWMTVLLALWGTALLLRVLYTTEITVTWAWALLLAGGFVCSVGVGWHARNLAEQYRRH